MSGLPKGDGLCFLWIILPIDPPPLSHPLIKVPRGERITFAINYCDFYFESHNDTLKYIHLDSSQYMNINICMWYGSKI